MGLSNVTPRHYSGEFKPRLRPSQKGDFIPHHCIRTKKNKLQVINNNPVDPVRFYEKPDFDL